MFAPCHCLCRRSTFVHSWIIPSWSLVSSKHERKDLSLRCCAFQNQLTSALFYIWAKGFFSCQKRPPLYPNSISLTFGCISIHSLSIPHCSGGSDSVMLLTPSHIRLANLTNLFQIMSLHLSLIHI